MNKPEEAAALPKPIEWSAVQALAMVVGVREAARRMGLSEEAVKRRCSREGWLKSPEAKAANKLAVAQRTGITAPASPHLSPGALILQEISALGQQSRLSLAKGVRKAAEHIEHLDGGEILERAADVKGIAQTADLVHGWKDQAPNVKIRLDVLNAPAEAPIIDIEADVQTSESDWGAESYDLDDF